MTDAKEPSGPPPDTPDRSREPDARDTAPREGVSRRFFLKGAGLSIAAVGATGVAGVAADAQTDTQTGVPIVGPEPVRCSFQINGAARTAEIEPSTTLLDMVRDRFDLTGAKRVCDRGSCGACTMIVDGRPVNACSMLAVDAQGKEIRTVESVAEDGKLSPLQEAFVDCDALQCGFCTPGMVMACTALLERNPKPSGNDVRQAIAGNICRCGTYENILEAVAKATRKKGEFRVR